MRAGDYSEEQADSSAACGVHASHGRASRLAGRCTTGTGNKAHGSPKLEAPRRPVATEHIRKLWYRRELLISENKCCAAKCHSVINSVFKETKCKTIHTEFKTRHCWGSFYKQWAWRNLLGTQQLGVTCSGKLIPTTTCSKAHLSPAGPPGLLAYACSLGARRKACSGWESVPDLQLFWVTYSSFQPRDGNGTPVPNLLGPAAAPQGPESLRTVLRSQGRNFTSSCATGRHPQYA